MPRVPSSAQRAWISCSKGRPGQAMAAFWQGGSIRQPKSSRQHALSKCMLPQEQRQSGAKCQLCLCRNARASDVITLEAQEL
jgi:hypothetical protein